MAASDFAAELRELGYEVTEIAPDRVQFPFTIDVGPRQGELVSLGFVVPGDYRLTPPSGPHVSPRLFPLQSGGVHPTGGIHNSDFGLDFQYWSRPFPNWPASGRTTRVYMAFIRGLFASL